MRATPTNPKHFGFVQAVKSRDEQRYGLIELISRGVRELLAQPGSPRIGNDRFAAGGEVKVHASSMMFVGSPRQVTVAFKNREGLRHRASSEAEVLRHGQRKVAVVVGIPKKHQHLELYGEKPVACGIVANRELELSRQAVKEDC